MHVVACCPDGSQIVYGPLPELPDDLLGTAARPQGIGHICQIILSCETAPHRPLSGRTLPCQADSNGPSPNSTAAMKQPTGPAAGIKSKYASHRNDVVRSVGHHGVVGGTIARADRTRYSPRRLQFTGNHPEEFTKH